MKKIGEYTTRGTVVSDNLVNRITLDDGSFETGYRVVEFRIGPNNMTQTTTQHLCAKLMTDDNAATGVNWNWENNEEIAWCRIGWDGNGPQFNQEFTLVDPDNLVIQDLYLVADEPSQAGDVKINYFIRLEKYQISDWQGALGMVRNRSQA